MDEAQRICLFCGHEHPASEDTCPRCGRSPIDQMLTPADPEPTAAEPPEPVQLGFTTDPNAAGDAAPPPVPPPPAPTVSPRDEPEPDSRDDGAAAAESAAPEAESVPPAPVAPSAEPDPVDDDLVDAMTAWPEDDLDWLEPAETSDAAPTGAAITEDEPQPIQERRLAEDAAADPTALIAASAPLETSEDAAQDPFDVPSEAAPALPDEPEPDTRHAIPAVPPTEQPASASAEAEPPVTEEAAPTAIAAVVTGGPGGARADGSQRKGRSQSLIVGLIVLAVIVGWFLVLNQISQEGGDGGEIDGVQVVASSSEAPTTSTSPDTTAPPTTEGAAATTTSSTTTTSTLPQVPEIAAAGEPIAVADLGLGAFALGSLDFGSSEALGRLVATFGQPDSYSPMVGAFGLCQDADGFTTSWGPLTTVFAGSLEAATFEGYRVATGSEQHEAAGLTTLSGLSAGDTVADLKSVYSSFIVSLEDEDDGSRFILTRGSDAATLLWGPVSSIEDSGTVLGVYSPDACDGGPTPTP